MKMNLFYTIRVDLRRAILSWRFPVSVVAGTLICYFTMLFCNNLNTDTIHTFIYIHDRSQSFLAYIVGILPYVMCFYDDFSYGNIKNVLGRINIYTYVISKSVVAVFATVMSFGLGKLSFVFLHSLSHSLGTLDMINMLPTNMMFFDYIREEKCLTYLILLIIPRALYCGILCQLAMLVSVLIHNRAIIFSVPIAIYYVINFYLKNLISVDRLNFVKVFDGTTRLYANDMTTFCYSVSVALVTYYIIYQFTVWILKGKISHG